MDGNGAGPKKSTQNHDAKGSGKTFLVHNRSGNHLPGQEQPSAMKKNKKYTRVPVKEKGGDIIDIKGIEEKGYAQQDPILLNSLTPEESKQCRQGLYFQDDQRRVDYVLTYHVKKPSSSRSRRHSSRLMESALARSIRRARAPPPRDDPEIAAQEHSVDYHEDDKFFRREEFEGNLQEMGLELEKDESAKTPGVGFVKIHAPWHVLCREAEFMKLKMPTKKVYEVKQGGNVVEKINVFIHKVTEPLHPNVEENRIQNVKHLSYPFSREKQHMFDLSDRDSFFDSKTRSSIVSSLPDDWGRLQIRT